MWIEMENQVTANRCDNNGIWKARQAMQSEVKQGRVDNDDVGYRTFSVFVHSVHSALSWYVSTLIRSFVCSLPWHDAIHELYANIELNM